MTLVVSGLNHLDNRSNHRKRSVRKEAETYKFIKKETLAQVFSSKFCEISKNTFFTEDLWVATSVIIV